MTTTTVCAACGMPAHTGHFYAHRHPRRTVDLELREGETEGDAILRYRNERGWVTRPGTSYAATIAELQTTQEPA